MLQCAFTSLYIARRVTYNLTFATVAHSQPFPFPMSKIPKVTQNLHTNFSMLYVDDFKGYFGRVSIEWE
jgi:hypothetical protein